MGFLSNNPDKRHTDSMKNFKKAQAAMQRAAQRASNMTSVNTEDVTRISAETSQRRKLGLAITVGAVAAVGVFTMVKDNVDRINDTLDNVVTERENCIEQIPETVPRSIGALMIAECSQIGVPQTVADPAGK